ncbi:MAG: HNH endonuclease [Isosphaera sp.]|nr:HNH endonuclease [Isosphaera sp.]
MSVVPGSVRAEVVTRAGNRCEYCRLPARGQVATFPIDHVNPRTAGGSDDPSNLALACPSCNGHKWAFTDGADPASGEPVRLFNPRSDIWEEHPGWSSVSPGQLVATTAIGRGTIERLRMNDSDLIVLRRLLAEDGLFPEIT